MKAICLLILKLNIEWGVIMGFMDWFLGIFSFEDPHSELKRHSRKDCAVRLLSDVKHPNHHFRVINGLELRNMCDLADALEVMDDQTFAYHVNDTRNDFAEWVKDILGDQHLAEKMENLESRDDYAKAANVRVDYFKKMLR